MKKVVILFLSVLVVLFSAGYSSNTNRINNSADNLNIDDMKSSVIKNLNESIEKNGNSLSSEDIIKNCDDLYEKAEDFTDEDLLSIVTNSELNSITKSTLIQMSNKINKGKGIKSKSKFEELISQKSVDANVRINLIQILDMSSNKNKDNLENIIKNESGAIVVRSLMKMQNVDAKRSLKISNNVIENDNKYNEDTIRAAVMVISDYFQDISLSETNKSINSKKKKYINFCISKYNTTNNELLKDALVFSLINMLDFDAIKAVVQHKDIDYSLKLTCIGRNYQTFVRVINDHPSKDDVDFIISAMEIAPIKDLANIIKEKLESNPNFHSERLSTVITTMESSGFEADKKMYLKTPNQEWLN